MKTEIREITGHVQTDQTLAQAAAGAIGKTITKMQWEDCCIVLKECILTEERIGQEYETGRKIGREEERSRIVIILEQKAAAAFLDNRDEEAQKLRSLIKEIQGKQT